MRKILKFIALALLFLVVIAARRCTSCRGPTSRVHDRRTQRPLVMARKGGNLSDDQRARRHGMACGQTPRAAQGLTVARFADGLDHPRTMLVLPNGDVLVAEAQSPRVTIRGSRARSWAA